MQALSTVEYTRQIQLTWEY